MIQTLNTLSEKARREGILSLEAEVQKLSDPFLTSGHAEPVLPLIGEVPLASALGFDSGVYLVVFGGAMLILSMMGPVRPPRAAIAEKAA